MYFSKKHLAVIIALSFSFKANAVVCIDAIGNALQLEEMVSSAARWVEEKSAWAAEYAQENALAEFEDMQSEYRASAEISAVTTSVSSTANAHAEERYIASPSACSAIQGAKALYDSFSANLCAEDESKVAVESLELSKITDCGVGGSGLHCGALKKKRESISSRLVSAVNEKDGESLAAMLDGGTVLGVGDGVMSPDKQQAQDDAFALILGVEDTKSLPRRLDGSLATNDDPHAIAATTQWARQHALESIPNSALKRIKGLYDHQDGKKSIIAQLEERVQYYNSEEFLKLITNTNSKDSLPADWGTMHPEAKFSYLQTLPSSEQPVSSEQVTRMIAEMISLQLALDFLTTESALSSNALIAIQSKVQM
ncbi:hypothetical protein [Aliivibrio finisterrensis]|uniref:Uncharacterized protein n=1 Tax=Aliivibrio finisterrensis TaxID=511998 RepID=A0ABY0I7S1_9GAMM|nr:hypothetical protein [Aliivibrio finisterrensis]RYU63828.1 hypothetical protein ERW53_12375 [Aliivibrio finisterrensis]RYU82765.1 hypothetical protein ERW52_14200 [Aliivibrio finisterrensis]